MRISDLQIGLEGPEACRYDNRQYGLGVLYTVPQSVPDGEPQITPLMFQYDVSLLQKDRFSLTVADVMNAAREDVMGDQMSDERRVAVAESPVVGIMLAQMCGKMRSGKTRYHGIERLASVVVGDITTASQVYDVSRGIANPGQTSIVRPSRIKYPKYADNILRNPNILFSALPLTAAEGEALTVGRVLPVLSSEVVSFFGLRRNTQTLYMALHNVGPETAATVETVVHPDQISSLHIGKILR